MAENNAEKIMAWLVERDRWEPCYETQEKLISITRLLLDAGDQISTGKRKAGFHRDSCIVTARKALAEAAKEVSE